MIRTALVGAAVAAILFAPMPSLASVKVRFVNPERYTDAGTFDAGSREATLAELRAYLERLGERFLAPGEALMIDVLNVDLAGHREPWRRSFSDVRIMRDVTPPRIKLRYVLSEKGKRRRSGEQDLTDINYQMNSARASGDRYGYEKALLADWFRQNFARR
ncbi:DUF3016 domain-containing protein [Bradyrhizobium sp. LHD-71]|uniref:DUF3016 domain-containing protein n=1 Tax=Bradyrhizobium sp. LHD-71 TaxID=3072141 RepID=UPI00280D2CA1|nr:DUF3016 domain-containing protein [Bradyrhizobium sp. LHD-71]MDQ8730214.1 DUF3016 domain-containing protein [Bradyrhizobium sp. LHD-71]